MNNYFYFLSGHTGYFESDSFIIGFSKDFEECFSFLEKINNEHESRFDDDIIITFSRNKTGFDQVYEPILIVSYILDSDQFGDKYSVQPSIRTFSDEEIATFYKIAAQAGFNDKTRLESFLNKFHSPTHVAEVEAMRKKFQDLMTATKKLNE